MYNIVVGIPTYKRPFMLKKLILSIMNNDINQALIKNVNIVIIDNDLEKTAEIIVRDLKNNVRSKCQLNYYNYPIKGLSNVRNELLKRAQEFYPDFVVSIDDDEYSTPNWLNELVLTITSNKADIVLGPVIPEMEIKVPESISFHFTYHKITNNKQIRFLETNNYIIDAKFLQKNKMRFDDRFNFTGSEDHYFGIQALNKGAKIFWAKNAVTYETIPLKRASLNWLIKRNYRSALTFTYILLLERNYIHLLKKMSASVSYVVLGLITMIFLPFNFKYRYWGIIKIATALGGFAGLLNLKFYEYQKDLKSES